MVAAALRRTRRWADRRWRSVPPPFDGFCKKLIIARDRRCRDPFCDAPIRHIDHIQRYADGGLTIYPNGRGECERGNHAREMPGWHVETITSGLDGQPHTIKITTPTATPT